MQLPASPPIQITRSSSIIGQVITTRNANSPAMTLLRPDILEDNISRYQKEHRLFFYASLRCIAGGGYPGRLTKRGHEEAWTYPPLVDPTVKRSAETNILRCDDVKGLEQGIYIISRPLRINPINTPEGRHHMYLQVYRDPNANAEIDRAQARVDRLDEARRGFYHNIFARATEKQLLEERLDEARQALEAVTIKANRARMMENSGLTRDAQGKLGSIVTISSMDHGQTILPDLNQPYLVISPILTKSDVEKVEGGKWVDPELNVYSERIAMIRSIPYMLFGHNCKVAALELAITAVDAIPGLTCELRKYAQANLDKPINTNIPLHHIISKTVSRSFNRILRPADHLPDSHIIHEVTDGILELENDDQCESVSYSA